MISYLADFEEQAIMARVVWKDGHVISVETRTGLFVLAQMSREPFLIFFDAFSTDDNWDHIDLTTTPILFCKAVVRQFLQCSHVTKHRVVTPLYVTDLPTCWIHATHEFRQVKAWPGTRHEREFWTVGDGGSLVENEVLRHPGGPRAHPSGCFDRVLIQSINPSDSETIDRYELDSLGVFPATNERLYLCHRFGRSVDPDKDILFHRDLPLEYAPYIDLIRCESDEERTRLNELYSFSDS